MDGEFTHPDIGIAAIAATPIARFEDLPRAGGMSRFKVVSVVEINVIPCNTIEQRCLAGKELRLDSPQSTREMG